MPSAAYNSWLESFRTTGAISPLVFGMSREELRAVLGDPDITGAQSPKRTIPVIWKYSGLEFHFGPRPEDGLWLIYSEKPDGSVDINLAKGTK